MRQAATSFIGFEGENDEGEEVEKVTSIVYYVGTFQKGIASKKGST